MSSWKKIALAISIIIVLLISIAVFLLGTTIGLRLIITTAINWVPGLKIGQVAIAENRDTLLIKNVYYDEPGLSMNAKELRLKVKLKYLFNRKLNIKNLEINNVNLTIDSKKILKLKKIKEWNRKLLGISNINFVIFRQLTLNNAHFTIGNATISITRFSSGFLWEKKIITFFPTTLRGALIVIPKNERIFKQDKIKERIYNLYLEQRLSKERMSESFLSKLITSGIDCFHSPLNLTLQEFTGKQLHLVGIGNTNLEVQHLFFKGSTVNHGIRIDTLNVHSNVGVLRVTGGVHLRHNWPINIALSATLNKSSLKGEKITLYINGYLKDNIEIKGSLYGISDMKIRSKICLNKKGIPLDLEVISNQFYWTLLKQKIQLSSLKMRLRGKVTDYVLSCFTAIKGGDGVPSSVVTLNAKGNERQINLNKLSIKTLDGTLQLIALLKWQRTLIWYSEAQLYDINLEKAIPNFPLKINGIFKINGSLNGTMWNMEVPEIKLAGNAKENHIKIAGALKSDGFLQWVTSLRMGEEQNSTTLRGKLNVKKINLNVKVDAPKLDRMIPGVVGSTTGTLKLHNTVYKSKLLSDITVSNLKWKDLNISHAKININVQSGNQIKGNLDLHFEKIIRPGININLATLIAKGNEQKHILRLYMQSRSISGKIDVKGSFDRKLGKWKGELNKISCSSPIELMAPDRAITVDCYNTERKIPIKTHLRQHPNIELFFARTATNGISVCLAANLHHYNLNSSVVPKIFSLGGSQKTEDLFISKREISCNSTTEAQKTSKLNLYGKNLKMIKQINGVPLILVFDVLRLNAWIRDNCIEVSWLTYLTHGGRINGKIKIIDLQKKRDLIGNVNIRNVNFTTENPFFSKTQDVVGVLDANLQLRGNLGAPKIFGKIKLDSVDINNGFFPFEMKESKLTINFKGMYFTYLGVIHTQKSEIKLSGTVNWNPSKDWNALVIAKGKKILLTVPSVGVFEVSPSVIFEARSPRFFALHGYIEVPWARIVIHKISDSTIPVSGDEIIFDKSQNFLENQKRRGIPIHTNLMIRAGNDVYMDAFGVKAKLIGNLQVVHNNEKGFGFTGKINIQEGRFNAYGQDLIIRKGSLLFFGPTDAPIINIEAIRNPESTENNVIAGIRISSSTHNKPKIEIFSDPIMSRQEALSYLLRGHGPNKNQNDGMTITSILVSLGIAQGDQVVGKIGNRIGISNLMLDTQGIGDSSKVIISGYLLPDLQIKYGVGIFDSLATLVIRYRLIPKLYLEAVSGIDQVLNLLYQLEF